MGRLQSGYDRRCVLITVIVVVAGVDGDVLLPRGGIYMCGCLVFGRTITRPSPTLLLPIPPQHHSS
jgi:hypothetical protein